MNILIGGASGLVGSALCDHLVSSGHQITRLVRRQTEVGRDGILWSPRSGQLTLPEETTFDAVIHLGGSNIAGGRWTRRRKRELRDSRIESTHLLAQTLAASPRKPKIFACASAVGIYGDRGDELLTEESSSGTDFLGRLAREWEAACHPAGQAGIRVVHLRLGVVLSRAGGALARMLTPFRMGFGGRLGSGRQYMSWISLEDAVRAIEFCLSRDSLKGPVNLASPHPVTNREFTRELASAIHRPAWFPVPAWILRMLLGEMADAALLSSTRALPEKLIHAGFEFRHPELCGVSRDF